MKQSNNRTIELHKKPRYKRWWIWALGILLLVVLILVLSFINEVNKMAKAVRTGQIDPASFAQETTRLDPADISVGHGGAGSSGSINVASPDAPFLGPEAAQVVVVEFGDFQCPFCRRSFPIVRELAANFKDEVKFIWRDFPITSIHPEAQLAAEAARCANEQGGFWAYHDRLFINQDDLSVTALSNYAQQVGLDVSSFNDCLLSGRHKQAVLADFQDGITAGVQGTPTFFINGQPVQGAVPKDVFERVIRGELELYDI